MEDTAKLGGARDSAGRPVSKLLVSSSHAVSKVHHGDFKVEIPNNDSITCLDPCFVGVSDLQLGNTGAGMSNVVAGVNDKIYFAVATSGASPPPLSFHIVTVPAGHWSLSALAEQIRIKMDAVDVPVNARYTCVPNNTTSKITITQVNGTGNGFVVYDSKSLLTVTGFGSGTGIPADQQQSMQDILNLPDPSENAMTFVGTLNLTVMTSTGPVNLLSHPSGVFLRESSLGHSVIDSLGKRSVIRRIPIRSNWGEQEYDDLQSGTRDFIDCSGQSLRSLHFRLTDDKNTVIPLETPLSFSLIFSPTHN
jgi:hypothetical protein